MSGYHLTVILVIATIRYKPTAHVQKKVNQAWKPKQVVQAKGIETHDDVQSTTMQDEPSRELLPKLDMPVTPVIPGKDDGWRLVSRRKGSTRSPVRNVGLAQVHTGSVSVLSEGSGGVEGGSSAIT